MDQFDKIERKIAMLIGMQDEAHAKIRFLKDLNRQKPHMRQEIQVQVEKITKDLNRYKRLREKVELEIEEIYNGIDEFY